MRGLHRAVLQEQDGTRGGRGPGGDRRGHRSHSHRDARAERYRERAAEAAVREAAQRAGLPAGLDANDQRRLCRWCEIDDDCDDGKTCQASPHVDPDLGKIKTCQTAVAAKPAAGRGVPKCKSGENLDATAVTAAPFCAKSCSADKDCSSHSCVSVVELDDDGKPMRAMNGNPISDTACAPAAAAADDDCPGSLSVRCKGVCVNIQTDDKNCGACGTVCRAGTHRNMAMTCRDEQGNF